MNNVKNEQKNTGEDKCAKTVQAAGSVGLKPAHEADNERDTQCGHESALTSP